MSTVSFQSRRAKKADASKIEQTEPLDGLSPQVRAALEELWTALLKVPSVQSDDNFFELGGTSLHAMLIASRVEAQLDSEMSLADFFDDPTFRGLCRSVTPIDAGES